jgi:hypothetical protein
LVDYDILTDIEDEDEWWFYPVGKNMQKVNVDAFYRFGARMKDAMSIGLEPLLKNGMIEASWVEKSLEAIYANCLIFLRKTEGYNLPKSREKAKEIEDLELRYWKHVAIAAKEENEQERQELFKRFLPQCKRLLTEFESALRHEVSNINAFVIDEKGSYDIHKLIERAHEHFSEEVRKHLPDTAIYDFKEAGKCLAFDCPTAMAYHILRGTEAMVLAYFAVLNGSAYSGRPGWMNYINALRPLSAPSRILQRLDEIREYERNPIAHPEFVVEPDEAMPLYNLVHGVIPMMAKEMQRINPK